MSPRQISAASQSAGTAAMPAARLRPIPSAQSGAVTNCTSCPASAVRTAASSWPSTTIGGGSPAAAIASTACATKGLPRQGASNLWPAPKRLERPAASSIAPTRPGALATARGSGRSASGKRPPSPMAAIVSAFTAKSAARRSSTRSRPLRLGLLAQPGSPITGRPASVPSTSRLPGSTGMPSRSTVPPAAIMACGITSPRSTVADAPATKRRSALHRVS